MAITESLLGAVLSFVVVTAATYASTAVFTENASLLHSAVTAVVTSVVWFGVTYLISGAVGVSGYWIALGPLLAAIAYLLVIDWRHEGGIVRAVGITAGTWLLTFGILFAAAWLGYSSFQAVGIPFAG